MISQMHRNSTLQKHKEKDDKISKSNQEQFELVQKASVAVAKYTSLAPDQVDKKMLKESVFFQRE